MEHSSSCLERIRKILSHSSTLVVLKRGFGGRYQCGYEDALENRESRLLAAARGSNPLRSAALRDSRDIRITLAGEWFLTTLSLGGILKSVLKRGTVPTFQGARTGRLSLLSSILPRIFSHA